MVKVNAVILCSGSPNYFIYAVSTSYDSKGDTYSLINNNAWVRSSNRLTEDEQNKFFVVGKENIYINP